MWLDFFSEDEEIEQSVKEIVKKQEEIDKKVITKDQQNQKIKLEQIKKIKKKLIIKTLKTQNTSTKFKINFKKLIENILKKDWKIKSNY
jgi:hypothetical protein